MKMRNIFIADDDTDDIEIFQEALGEVSPSSHFTSSKNGLELLEKLSIATPLPELLFVDVNMPMMNGLEALAKIKADERLSTVPIIILTTSASPGTIELAYELGANLIVEKPCEFRDLKNMITKVMMIDWGNYSVSSMTEIVYKAS